jgi:glucokinase
VSLVVGIDAGGTKLAAGLVDTTVGRVLDRRQASSDPARGGAAVLADCLALARAVVGSQPADGVGIAVPELVSQEGEITTHDNWDWRGWDLRSAFAHFGSVQVESDVRAAALGEAKLGAGKEFASFIYMTIGTGVSHTFVIEGTPWTGARGNAIVVGAPLVELVASGPQLARLTGKARAEDVLATAADAPAVGEVARTLASELARLINALDPEAALIGGGLGLAPEFTSRLIEMTRPLIYAEDTRQLAILPAALENNAGLVGAALAVDHRPRRDRTPS